MIVDVLTNLPNPDIIAQEIVDDLEAALEQFRLIANDLGGELSDVKTCRDLGSAEI
ncbi:MAG: hypothetical protein SGJ26_19845 [Nitrospirota bacterium]|nr:hypothetical protein [Nitrospirota bacterium]